MKYSLIPRHGTGRSARLAPAFAWMPCATEFSSLGVSPSVPCAVVPLQSQSVRLFDLENDGLLVSVADISSSCVERVVVTRAKPGSL